jgi:hypothetical protein
MTLVERDALMLADMLQDEGIGPDEVDQDAVRHLVYEAGGFPTPLRRAYDEVYRRWRSGGSPRDRLACLLLSHAHIAAARASSGDSDAYRPASERHPLPGGGMFVDWSHDDRPTWQVALHYRRPVWDSADLPSEAAERIASELRKSGMTRHVQISVDLDHAGYELAFRIHAHDHAQAEAAAETLARTCLDRAGMPFGRSINGRSVSRCEPLSQASA